MDYSNIKISHMGPKRHFAELKECFQRSRLIDVNRGKSTQVYG